ncbi:MAG TPA: YpmS family protein [Pseudogracilibacillus sp.]|nr:YpmS family protein [Pseudogracilibacillus sp.]
MKRSQKHNKGSWKVLFFIMLALNLLFISVSVYIIYPLVKPVAEDDELISMPPLTSAGTPIYIHATKENITGVVESFLRENQEEESFTILLDDTVDFLTDASLFGLELSLEARFEPIVEPDGNLSLKQKAISFGRIQIPNEYALKYIANSFDLPPWVHIRPSEEMIYLDLHAAQVGKEYFVKVNKFDLTNDELIFEVHIIDE